jgi:molecular chaperone DnaK (HSP70)
MDLISPFLFCSVLVSFLGNERFMGEAAVSQLRTNMANTVTQVKRLLGRKFSDEVVQEDIKTHLNYKIVQLPGDEIGIEVCLFAAVSFILS